MFRGITIAPLDGKNRLSVPTRYRTLLREQADNKLVITIDTQDPCLLIYPLPEWERIEQSIQALPSLNPVARRIQRLLIGHATEIELDSSGRILLPALLKEHAQLEREAVLVGQGKKFELWSDTLWQTHRDDWLSQEKKEAKLPDEWTDLPL